MILIAPDKYRGTLTADYAARIIKTNVDIPSVCLPMADGGEGTARCIASTAGWEYVSEGCYLNRLTHEIAIDSSSFIGYGNFPRHIAPMERSSAPLAEAINNLYAAHKPHIIYIGVGGTAVCDGGEGFLRNLKKGIPWKEILIGLVDVKVPLLPDFPGQSSSLMFCKQKGIADCQLNDVETRLKNIVRQYGVPSSPYDGAGGGLGYALASVLGAMCYSGADWLIKRAKIPWEDIDTVITGEGRFDSQSLEGKVVSTLLAYTRKFDIPLVCMAGSVEPGSGSPNGLELIDLATFLPDAPLTPAIAAERLALATRHVFNGI